MKIPAIGYIFLISFIVMSFVPAAVSGEDSPKMQKICGTVTEFNGTRAAGEPVPGAEVYIEQEPNEEPMSFTNQTKTDSEGYFKIFQKAGDYRITVKASGFKKITKVVTVKEGRDLEINIEMLPGNDTYDVDLEPEDITSTVRPGGSVVLQLTVKNTGNTSDSYNVSIKGDKMPWVSMGSTRSTANGGPYSQSVSNLEDNGISDIEINVTVPGDTEPGNYTFTITTRSYWDQQVMEEIPLTLTVKAVEPEPEPIPEEEDSGLPFLSLSALLVLFFAGGAIRRRRA
jgi:carboxypeptidase family protein